MQCRLYCMQLAINCTPMYAVASLRRPILLYDSDPPYRHAFGPMHTLNYFPRHPTSIVWAYPIKSSWFASLSVLSIYLAVVRSFRTNYLYIFHWANSSQVPDIGSWHRRLRLGRWDNKESRFWNVFLWFISSEFCRVIMRFKLLYIEIELASLQPTFE